MQLESANILFYLSATVLVFLLVVLLLRAVATWYFKINRRIELMEKQCNQNIRLIEEVIALRESLSQKASQDAPDKDNLAA